MNISHGDQKKNNEDASSSIHLNTKAILIRSSVVFIFLILVFSLNNYFKGSVNLLAVDQCYNDQLHDLTDLLNKYFIKETAYRNIMMIFTALLVDLSMLTTFFFWTFVWTDWVIPYALLLFYGVRGAVVLNLFQLTFPTGYNFVYPGFPSIAVCYLPTNDFFYSGHIGFPIIFALEYSRKNQNYLVIPCIIVSLLEGCMMVITRGHYTIDLIFGIIYAHYLYKIALI